MLFNIALNYGGRTEIVDAARRAIAAGIAPDDLDERTFASFLYTAGQPDPDLLIRTSGEMRVSNFLLWQIAYSEIWVTETLWPDFRRRDLLKRSSPIRSATAATAASSRRRWPSAPSDRRHSVPQCGVRSAHDSACERRRAGAGAVAAVWFAPPWLLFLIAEGLLLLGASRVSRIWRSRCGLTAPWLAAGALAMICCAAVAVEPGARRESSPIAALMSGVVIIGTGVAVALARWHRRARLDGRRALSGALSRSSDRRDGGDPRTRGAPGAVSADADDHRRATPRSTTPAAPSAGGRWRRRSARRRPSRAPSAVSSSARPSWRARVRGG